MSYKVGQQVIVDDKSGYTVVKINKNSCKVKSSDGKISIKPNCFIEPDDGKQEKSGGGKSRKRTSSEMKKPAGGKKIHPHEKHVQDYGDEEQKSRKRTKPYTRPDDDEDDGSAAGEVDTSVHKKKSRKGIDDTVSKLLGKLDTPTKMIDAVKHHKDYKNMNADAFKRTVSQKNDLPSGLFRMRMGNLLRGAINRTEKLKNKKAGK